MAGNIGGNMTTLKIQNRSSILNILKRNGACSRLDIANTLGLTPAAITILVSEMVSEGIIEEIGQLEEKDKRSGRKKVLIDINYNYKHVIGINIEANSINIGVSNLKGDVVISEKITTDKDISPEELLKNVSKECMNVLWKKNILQQDILGVGVGIIGPVDEKEGISIRAYGLWNKRVEIKKILEKELGTKVVVDNNVRTLAVGEIDYRNEEENSNMLFIKYGPGIGSAVIINSELYYGSSNSSAEIGHSIVDLNGEICRCGKRGCLETVSSKSALLRKVKEIFSKENTPILYENIDGEIEKIEFKHLIKAAEMGDREVKNILSNSILYLALTIGNTILVYDPKSIVLYGDLFKSDMFLNEFKETLSKIVCIENMDDFLSLSQLSKRSNYIGSISLALREFFYNVGGM
ncbi:MAG: ROK family transcriptional regulator [Clostridiaceae bacterium]